MVLRVWGRGGGGGGQKNRARRKAGETNGIWASSGSASSRWEVGRGIYLVLGCFGSRGHRRGDLVEGKGLQVDTLVPGGKGAYWGVLYGAQGN